MYLSFNSKLGLKKSDALSKSSKEINCGPGIQKNDMQKDISGANGANKTGRTNFNDSSTCQIWDEVTDLHRQIAELVGTINDLTRAIRSKDVHLENIQRDNVRLAAELKKQQRCNRDLKQQLVDERFFYQKEKEHFRQEIQSNGRNPCVTSKVRQRQRELEKNRDPLDDEIKELRSEIIDRNKVAYKLCIKFLRMKHARDTLRQKLDSLLQEHLQVIAEMMEKLDEAREELNIIVSEKFREPLPISKAKFLQVVQRNSKLVYEHATLKLHVQQLQQNIERLKSDEQKTKTINVDARTIERLTDCSRRRQDREAKKIFSNTSCSTNNANSFTVSKLSSSISSPGTDKSRGAKVITSLKLKNREREQMAGDHGQISDLRVNETRSAPQIAMVSNFRQVQFSEDSSATVSDSSERISEFRETEPSMEMTNFSKKKSVHRDAGHK